MGQLVSLADRREVWKKTYVSPDGRMSICLSSHGRLSLNLDGKMTVLEFTDMVHCISSINEEMKNTFAV